MTDKKAQLEISVNAEPAEKGFKRVEAAAKGAGDTVKKSSDKGAKAVKDFGNETHQQAGVAKKSFDQQGQSSAKAAKDIETGTRSMIASVQRATAQYEAGRKGSAKYFEVLAKQRGLNMADVQPHLNALRAMEESQKKVTTSAQGMTSGMGFAVTAIKGLAVGLSAVSMVNFVKSTALAGRELSRFSVLANTGTADFQKLTIASSRFGVSQEKLADILKDTQDKVGDFLQSGGGAMADFFENIAPAVGVTAEQFRQLSGKDALQLYVSSLEKANLSQADMTFYMEAIASDSTLLLPLLQKNGEAFNKIATEAEALGLILGEDVIAANKALNENMETLGRVVNASAVAIAGPLVSALVDVTNRFMRAKVEGDGFFKALSRGFGADMVGRRDNVLDAAADIESLTQKLQDLQERQRQGYIPEGSQEEFVLGATSADLAQAVKNYNALAEAMANVAAQEVETTKITVLSAAQRKANDAADTAAAKIRSEQQKADAQALKDAAKLQQDIVKLHEDSIKPQQASLAAAQSRIEAIKDEELAVALSRQANVSLAAAVEQVNIAKLKEQQIAAMGNDKAVALIQREIDARKELVGLVAGQEARKAADAQNKIDEKTAADQIKISQRAAQKAADDWKAAAQKIEDSITDALLRGFENGKSFAENLRDTVKNMFSTMVLRPVIQAVVGGVTGLGSLSAVAGGAGGGATGAAGGLGSLGGLANIASTAQSLYANVSTGFAGLGASVGSIGAASAYGTTAFSQQSAMLAAQEAGMGTVTGTMGSAASVMGGALVGLMAGKMISGGYSAMGKSGNAAVVAGTAIGAAFGGPLGAAFGGAIGGGVNRLFGRKAPQLTGEGIRGTLSDSGASLQSFQNTTAKGGTFRSDKRRTTTAAITGEMGNAIDTALVMASVATKSYAEAIGLSADAVQGFSKSINISLMGLDAAGREKAVTDAVEGFANSLAASLLKGAEQYQRSNETATQTLQRLSTSLIAVNGVMDTLGQTLMATTVAGAHAASQLADAFGGVQNLQVATTAYYQAFHTEAERNAKTTQQLSRALSALGVALPDTLAGFRAIVEAQDLTTEAGRRTYTAMVQLAPAFAQVTTAAGGLISKLGETVGSLADSTLRLVNNQIKASRGAADAARQAAEQFAEAGNALRSAARDILGSTSGPQANTLSAYTTGLSAARGGDADAMQALPGLATAMLAEQRSAARTRLDANIAAAQTAAELTQVSRLAADAQAQNNYQAKLFDVNTAILEVLAADVGSGTLTAQKLTEQLSALQGINTLLNKSQDVHIDALSAGEVAAIAVTGSETLLNAVLNQLQVPDASAQLLSSNILNGNEQLAGKFEILISAVNQQTAAQQAEVRRVQEVALRQKELESTAQLLVSAQAQADAAAKALAATSKTIEVYLGRGGYFGTGSKNYRYDPNPAFDTNTQNVAFANSNLARAQEILEMQRKAVRDLGGVPAFATGAAFTNGIATRPTAFDMGLMGEAGSEAIMPLANVGGSLGVRAQMPGAQEMTTALTKLLSEMQALRAEAQSTATSSARAARILDRVTQGSDSLMVTTQ